MSEKSNKTIVYSALEIANICGVVNQTAINWIRSGHLKAFSTPGGQYRVYSDDLIEFMKKRGMRIPAAILDTEDKESFTKSQSILIVDDDQGLNAVLKKYLEKIFPDSTFYQAFDGFDAGLQMVDKQPYCVLLDLDLPGINGFDLCKRLKTTTEFNKPYVIIITAMEDDDVKQQVLKLGADLFIKKPLNLSVLAEKMQNLLKKD